MQVAAGVVWLKWLNPRPTESRSRSDSKSRSYTRCARLEEWLRHLLGLGGAGAGVGVGEVVAGEGIDHGADFGDGDVGGVFAGGDELR